MNKLLPCPLGCNKGVIAKNFVIEGSVSCRGCKISIIRKHQDSPKGCLNNGMRLAIKAWNTRHEQPKTK